MDFRATDVIFFQLWFLKIQLLSNTGSWLNRQVVIEIAKINSIGSDWFFFSTEILGKYLLFAKFFTNIMSTIHTFILQCI